MSNKYSILMPPPNVSGSLHMGHALTFFLQDFLIRTAKMLMKHCHTYLLPGLDHGGISTQYSALKDIKNISELSSEEKFHKIQNFAENAKQNILYQMENFNLFYDIKNLQYTLCDKHIHLVNQSFVTLYNRGLITEEERIIYWDPYMKTSLSCLEVVHKTLQEKIYYIKYKFVNRNEYITVATTRPETMFGDVALAVGNKYKKLVNDKVIIPFTDKIISIIFDESVVDDFGTGVLKITPAHDENDFNIGRKHQLPIVSIFSESLQLNHECPKEFQGLDLLTSRQKIIKQLILIEQFEKEELITHAVMFGEKSGVRIETFVKKHWYLDLSNAAEKALQSLEEGKFKIFPIQWENTYKNWLQKLEPWCISREIFWGHKIPVWRTSQGNIIVAISEAEAEKKANGEAIIRDHFVLDTWFSSALWPLSFKQINKQFYPTDVLVTAHDIIFFWVAKMVMMSLELDNSLPFKNVLLHNLIRDGSGEKMSKTRGNVQDPMEIINEYKNTDVIRFALLSKITTRGQIRFSHKDLENGEHLLTKLKNAIKFLRLHYQEEDFQKIYHITTIEIKNELCGHFIDICNNLHHESLFNDYNIHQYIQNLYNFFWSDYCDWFMEMSKKQIKDKDIQFTLIFIMHKIIILFHGIFPDFTSQIYKELFNKDINNQIDIDIKYQINTHIQDLIYVVEKIRSLESLGILKAFIVENTFPIANESNIYEALKIKHQINHPAHQNNIKLREKKIYVENINILKLKILLDKKIKEIEILKAKIQEENPPQDIADQLQIRLKSFKEELAVLQEIIA